ncbi:hypothetical protein GCM10018779_21770 [Streptomyces griseocarneus]|nr:hypothetical protein GCM10018779_21770 [Streptomyces griseocarneus]
MGPEGPGWDVPFWGWIIYGPPLASREPRTSPQITLTPLPGPVPPRPLRPVVSRLPPRLENRTGSQKTDHPVSVVLHSPGTTLGPPDPRPGPAPTAPALRKRTIPSEW